MCSPLLPQSMNEMKLLLIHHHSVSFTAIPKTLHPSPPPPKPHRISFITAAPKTLRAVNTHNNTASASAAADADFDDAITYNTMIAARCKENSVGEAFGLLKAMIDKGMEPNSTSFNDVIHGLCGEEWRRREAREARYDLYLVADCEAKNLTRAVQLWDQMRVRGLSPNARTYTSLIDFLLANHTHWETEGYKAFDEMIDTGFSPSIPTCNRVLSLHCSSGRIEEAMGVFRGMVSPDVVSYNTLISWFCENKDLDKAFELKKEMMLEKGILPDTDTYRSLVLALCLQRRLSEAFDLFREMRLPPDEDTYKSLMTAYCVEGEFIKAFRLHDEMINKGFLPDFVREFSPSLVACNALIYAYCSLDRLEEAVGILRGMAEVGLSPDGVSYSLVISGFHRVREMRKAYEMKKEMEDKADEYLDQVTDESLMQDLFDEVTYTSLLNAYLDEGESFKVAELEYERQHFSSLPDSVALSVYINGLDKKDWTRETKANILHQIYGYSPLFPTYLTYDTLIENCSYNEFKSLVELVKGFCTRGLENASDTMLQWNYKPDGAVHNLFILEHCDCGNAHKAYNMYTEMVHYGFASHMFSVLTLIESLSRHRMYNELRWVIENTLRSCNLNDSELLKVLSEIDVRRFQIDPICNVLAEKAMDGLLLNGGKCLIGSAPNYKGLPPQDG